nr:class I SAM-dependent RNA methyltransferase [Methylobrevis pamukkalensis]
MEARLTIDRLGAQGDGVAAHAGAPVYLPFTLPGEEVLAEFAGERGDVLEIFSASPERIDPACPHFTDCGGCSLQHLAPAPYAAFKRELVVSAFAARGLAPEVDATIVVPAGSRRRVVLAARREGGKLLFGFHGRKSHRIVPLSACPVSRPEIVGALPGLARLAAVAAPRKGDLAMTVAATATGLDVALGGVPGKDLDRLRLDLVRIAGDIRLARLSAGDEVMMERIAPTVRFGTVDVTPPPGGFLQAAEAGEAALAALVVAAVGKANEVADLFAGAGTFAFRLAETAKVHAVEGDAPALAALDKGLRFAKGLRRLTTQRRDLFRRPVTAKELARFDAVVFDPPRAGASAQAAELAASKVPVIVAVSCNPATLARDARLLVDGGYRLERVTPVDQFLWSAHVEAVAVFRR